MSMRIGFRFVLPLLAVLALLAWGASIVVNDTLRRWFERDMYMRAEVAPE